MTEREALKHTINRWIGAAESPDPMKYLNSIPCMLCVHNDTNCFDCMLLGKGICTELYNHAVHFLILGDTHLFRGYAKQIVIKLQELDDEEDT